MAARLSLSRSVLGLSLLSLFPLPSSSVFHRLYLSPFLGVLVNSSIFFESPTPRRGNNCSPRAETFHGDARSVLLSPRFELKRLTPSSWKAGVIAPREALNPPPGYDLQEGCQFFIDSPRFSMLLLPRRDARRGRMPAAGTISPDVNDSMVDRRFGGESVARGGFPSEFFRTSMVLGISLFRGSSGSEAGFLECSVWRLY